MSRAAIAAALARDDLSTGERLVAFSLASFADRENRTRPGTPAAAARAGLKKSWFLEARELLERRGLVVVERAAAGRGQASTLWLPFVEIGPWWEGDINAELFETVLSYTQADGSVRLLLAAMAALADEHLIVEGVKTAELCAAAGVSDKTYRRAQTGLLASGELVRRRGTGGRGKRNCWEIPDPRARVGELQPARRRRVVPPAGQRPLLASISPTPPTALEESHNTAGHRVGGEGHGQLVGAGKGGSDRTVSAQNRPVGAGVSGAKRGAHRTLSAVNRPPGAGVSVLKGAADRTVSGETLAETPAETPAPNARAGREPQNPRTNPPSPPKGGSGTGRVLVEETYLTERGRRRRRLVAVDLAAVRERLTAAGGADRAAWEQVRTILREAVGESTFEIWLAPLELIAVDVEGTLIVSAPPETAGWVAGRFGRVLDGAAQRAGRPLRFADAAERKAAESLGPTAAATASPAPVSLSADARLGRRGGAAGRSADKPRARPGDVLTDIPDATEDEQSTRKPTYGSAYPASYTEVYTQTKEVS